MTTERFAYDIAFQAKLLRVLYQEPDYALSIGPHLHHTHFEKRTHRWFAKTVLDYAVKHGHGISKSALRIEASKALTVGRLRAKEDKDAVSTLITRATRKVTDKTYIKEELFRFVKNQTIKEVMLSSLDMMKRGEYEAIDTEFQRVLDVQLAAAGGLGHALVADAYERKKRRLAYEPDGIPTGMAVDDFLKPGGVPPKNLAAVIAPPHAGKSSTLVHIGRSAILEGSTPVLHITLEMSEDSIIDRYDAAFTGVKLSDLEHGKNPTRIRKFMRQLGKDLGGEPLVVKEFPMKSVSTRELRNFKLQLERKGFYPGVVIVDYAGILRPSVTTGDKYDDLGQVFIDLRRWAQEENIVLWTASQGNRASMGKEVITFKELADSFQPAMHADVLLALCQTNEEKTRRAARYMLMKNRHGKAEVEVRAKLDWARARVLAA